MCSILDMPDRFTTYRTLSNNIRAFHCVKTYKRKR